MNIPYWKPPKIWEGSSVYILGGGPSLKLLNWKALSSRRCRTIAVNNAYGYPSIKKFPNPFVSYSCRNFIDIVWFGDRDWFHLHQYSLVNFPGIVASCALNYLGVPWVNILKRGKPVGIDERPGYIAWNGNSGGSAINLAWHLGASSVFLFGFDMQTVNGDNNFHNHHKVKRTVGYSRFLDSFEAIARDAEKLGLTIVNATLGSALPFFPITDPNTILEHQNAKDSIK